MEDVLSQIVTAAASSNLVDVKKCAQDADGFLALQQGMIRDPAHELREKCLKVVKLCLESKKSKLVALAVSCCHKLLRDDRFHSNFELQDDSKWLLGQFMQAVSSFSNQTDDTKVDILKILLNIACGNVWIMNGRLVIAVISLCSEAFESGNTAVRSAAQAAACQTLRSFVSQLEEEMTTDDSEAVAFNDIIPIIQYICSRIDSSECLGRCEHGALFLLECLLTLFSCLPQCINKNKHIRMVLWQKMAPELISVLGTPRVDKLITSRGDGSDEWGRGSGCLAAAPTITTLHARAVYSISTELVRLIGPVPELRPMLESLFHRILLYPSADHRLDPLKATAELLRSPLRLVDIAGPFTQADGHLCDMALVRLIMDSIEDCRKCDLPQVTAAVTCICSFLKGLDELSQGTCLPVTTVDQILTTLPTLLQCEYAGPSYYQSAMRLPSAYQQRIQMEKNASRDKTGEESDSSGIGRKTDCSGDTEGPESLEYELEECLGESCTQNRFERLPRTLGVEIVDFPIGIGDCERQHARHFIGALHELLKVLQPIWCASQLDRAIQSFASQYCQGVVRDQPITEWRIIVNADGIYLTTLYALLLDLTLSDANYYSAPDQVPSLTEDEFVQQVQNSGVLVYLSGTWLREVYQAVVTGSLLQAHGFLPINNQTHSLIHLLTDIGGIGTRQKGCEMLWEYRRLECVSQTADATLEAVAGMRLARLLLTCGWSSIVRVLATPLSMKPARGRRKQQQLRDTVACSLEGLQTTAKLCSLLGVQDHCDLILELLSSASCGAQPERRLLGSRESTPRLTVPTALSLELILQQGLELGSHCPDCWPHVFRSVLFVRRMERAMFNPGGGLDLVVPAPPGINADAQHEDDEVDVYSFLKSSSADLMVSRYIKTAGFIDTLTPVQTTNVLTLLSYMTAEMIVDAAYQLNLRSLESFTRALCSASHLELYPPFKNKSMPTAASWIQKWLPSPESTGVNTFLLDLVGDLIVKCVRSSRPLAHIMSIWAVVGPHLTEAACHSDPTVSKKAVELIEAAISNHIKQADELPYFHFNEALFKPFENLLCLELCDGHIQDQIVASMCEFVEGSAADVRSGWRALFGALRAVATNSTQSSTFLDIFTLFLDTKSPVVFCSAAVDCILCLLKHVRSPSKPARITCLQFIQRFEDVLEAVYAMPQPLVFQAAHRLAISDGLLIDSQNILTQLSTFEIIPDDLKDLSSFQYQSLDVSKDETFLSLEKLDRPSGVLRVWFLLLEGLYSAAIASDTEAQPPLLDAVFSDIMTFIQRPDPSFGVFCVNRMLLPATQTWLRQCWREECSDFTGPKQALGLLSDFTVSCFKQHNQCVELQPEISVLLKQLLLVLTECAANFQTCSTPPSCMRHIVMNVGHIFSPLQWEIVTAAMRNTFEVTLLPLRHLLMAFSPGSNSFYGDYDQIKVAARRDSTSQDVLHQKHLAQQVFLLDGQRDDPNAVNDQNLVGERSYTFLLNPSSNPTDNTSMHRIPIRALVSSLLTHQALLQVTAGILLEGSSHIVPSLTNILLNTNLPRPTDSSLPGLMAFMKVENVLSFLDCLDISYRASLQFDARPGLKFLVQKVTCLERAANLYRQAGAAWAIKIVALSELCLHIVKEENLSAEEVKNISQCESNDSDLKIYLSRLQQSFNELCETYVDVVLDNDGSHSAVDRAADQPIFFLIACQDEQICQVQPRHGNSEKIQPDQLKEETPEKFEPFHLADFADTVSVSSTSESEVEIAEMYGEDLVWDAKKEGEEIFDVECTHEIKQIDDDSLSKPKSELETESVEKEKVSESEDIPEVNSQENNSKPAPDNNCTAEDDEDTNPNASLSVSNQNELSAALEEFKRRKKKHVQTKDLKETVAKQIFLQKTEIPPEVEAQRRTSFLKDSEAHQRVWAEMIGSVFHLLAQLSDQQFRILLPLLFTGIRKVTAHTADPALKQAIAELFNRVALVYGFGSMSS